ncbi:hypothetical protein BC826DRAFT_903028 [Russula brevipes]|nr:hypothetical protein BC826DRAFT_903028 [Russula brevipes]
MDITNIQRHTLLNTPRPPSPVEAQYYFYGIYSKPRLVARSSTDAWIVPRGPYEVLLPKEAGPLGFHPLQDIWEATVGPAMVGYLNTNGVKWTSLDPVRMGHTGDPCPPAIVWVGVLPGSLTAEIGVKVAIDCKGILDANGIHDVHIEIRESEIFRSAKMYKPVPTSNATVHVLEPFSTALGIPISTEDDPSIGGTGGFFVFDPCYPGKIFLVTARHVVIRPDKDNNELYQHSNTSQPRKVLLFSDPAAEEHIKAIESEIDGEKILIEQLERRLEVAGLLEEKYAAAEQEQVEALLKKARSAIIVLEKFLKDVPRDWKDRKDRVLGHVVLSPPLSLDVGEEGFAEDWAVIEVDKSKLDSTNFIGNAIDLGVRIGVDKFTAWMCPHPTDPCSFHYPGDRLHRFYSNIPDEEMWRSNSKTCDHKNDPVIMVMKRGHASGLTVGRLNTIRSFTRYYFNSEGMIMMSREVAVLPRNSESGPFSEPGDSGSAVIDGKGRLAGLLTSGAGVTDVSDCTYITSANFLCKRLLQQGLKANFHPL